MGSKRGPTSFSIDNLNLQLNASEADYNARKQDHHFEAMMLKDSLTQSIVDIQVVLSEVAAIDEFRFNRIFRDFSSRRVVIIEVAPKRPEEAVARLLQREGIDSSTADRRIGTTEMAANDALKFRQSRIDYCKANRKDYRLFCNEMTNSGSPKFISVLQIDSGNGVVSDGCEALFHELVLTHK
jgi:hypothetical protein